MSADYHAPQQPDTNNGGDTNPGGGSNNGGQAGPPNSCGCPTNPPADSGSNAQHPPLISADVDADLSGVQANADVLGHDVADISIKLGLIDDVLGLVDNGACTGLGLVDVGLGVVDDLLCGIA